jgi:Lrp/AsnC family leucine-responsive transcriptional regulator
MIDSTDRQILALLQHDARMANAEVARRLGMAPSAILERIRKLESRGIIQGYESRLSPRSLGLGLLAFVFVRSEERAGAEDAGRMLARVPEVLEVHHVAGEDCYLVKVRAADPEDLGRVLRERFGAIASIRSTRTTIVLGTLKESSSLPLESAARVEKESNDAA